MALYGFQLLIVYKHKDIFSNKKYGKFSTYSVNV